LVMEVRRLLLDHLQDHYALYGEDMGVRSARKHIGWYVHQLPQGDIFRRQMNTLETAQAQHQAVAEFFDALSVQFERLPHPQVSFESIALAPL
jgi:tRNA-dihydrouridine synthase B